ncbi:MAG: GCN5-related N-acetyltransferase [Frankiales bacterium]|nr:GCN5-related N-acetyltransferase [Frankiales bacterium]
MRGVNIAARNLEPRVGRPAELDGATVYRVLKLRTDVFVVEQECAYPELDGRDLEVDARWFWIADPDSGAVLATLRVLRDPDGSARIGRVATAPEARSAGLAARLMASALTDAGPEVAVVLDAQSQLRAWYGRFGFAVSGEEFIEDGIPHVPMLRPAKAGPPS